MRSALFAALLSSASSAAFAQGYDLRGQTLDADPTMIFLGPAGASAASLQSLSAYIQSVAGGQITAVQNAVSSVQSAEATDASNIGALQQKVTAFSNEPSSSSTGSTSFVATGGVTTLTMPAIEGRMFDPRSYGAPADATFHSIGSVYANATVESLAASNAAYAYLLDPRAGVKFTLTLTSITDSQHLVFTATQPGGNGVPAVAGVPQFSFNPLALYKQVLVGMVLTDTSTASATAGLKVASIVPWPVFGIAQPAGTPGTIVLSGAETGMKIGDTIQFEVSQAMLDSAYTMDWLGTGAAMKAADAAGGAVNLGPGIYHMGEGGLYAFGDNPVVVLGAGEHVTDLDWDTSQPVGGIYMGDGVGNVDYRLSDEYRDFTVQKTVSSATFGVAPDTGIDLVIGQNSIARRVNGNGGYATIGVLGDHNELDEVSGQTDFYGLFIMPFNQSNGNIRIENSSLQGYEASLGVSYDAVFNDNTIRGGEWAISPHLIYKETAFNSLIPASAVAPGCLTNTHVDWLAAENIGGTLIECNAGQISGNDIEYLAPGMNTTLDIAGETKSYFIHTTGTITGNRLVMSDFQPDAGSWPTVAWIYGGSFGPNDLGDMTNTVLWTGVPLLASGNPASVAGVTLEDRGTVSTGNSAIGGDVSLVAVQNYDSQGAALSRGQIVTIGQYGWPEVSRLAAPAAGQPTESPVGVVYQGCSWGQICLLATSGVTPVVHETSTGTSAPAGSTVYAWSGGESEGTVSPTADGPAIGTLLNYGQAKGDASILVRLR